MDSPEFPRAVVNGEQQWAAEGGDKIAEVAAAKLALTTNSHTKHSAVLGKDTAFDHVLQDCNSVGLRNLADDGAKPLINVGSSQTALL